MIAASPHIILVNNGIPAKTLARVHRAREGRSPASSLYASGGAGSPAHLGPNCSERRRHQAHARALQRHRPGDRRPARRPCHHDVLQPAARDRLCARRRCAARKSQARSARPCCPMCRPSPRRCRATSWRSATASSRRRTRRPRSSTKLNAALREALASEDVKVADRRRRRRDRRRVAGGIRRRHRARRGKWSNASCASWA